MSCDYHIFDGYSDKFYAECYRHNGIFFGILYTCDECGHIYFEKHCNKCQSRICDIGIPMSDECHCGVESDGE